MGHARRAASRLRMQAQVLAACKVRAAQSLAVLASVLAFMASSDNSASASASTKANICSCCVSYVGVAIAAAGVGCVIFSKEFITAD